MAAALAVAVAAPGPGVFAIVSCAIARGAREALALVCGIVLGDLAYFSCAVLGMAALARSMGGAFLAVKLAGAAYLAWTGVRLWLQDPAVTARAQEGSSRERGFARNVAGGLAVTLGNPKAIAFYAGLLPMVVTLEQLSAADVGAMAVIVVFVVGGILAAYALAAAHGRRFLGQPMRVRWLNRLAGLVMIAAAVAIALR
ncbi:MAG: LysE family translocator [Opitutaceae bacterium]|nr:LysE family translocator [Opitutaceae bacterium]